MTIRLVDIKSMPTDAMNNARGRIRQAANELMTAAIASEDIEAVRDAQIIVMLLDRK